MSTVPQDELNLVNVYRTARCPEFGYAYRTAR